MAIGLALLRVLAAVLLPAAAVPCAASALPACIPAEAETAAEPVTVAAGRLADGAGAGIVLAGVALPEAGDAAEADAGAILAAFAAAPLRIVAVDERDRYGRRVAMAASRGGTLLQAALVAAGAALVRPSGRLDPACAAALLALESSARARRAGLWRGASIPIKATDEASLSARNGLYSLVQGRVVSIGYGSRMVFLDFGHHFRTDFTIMVTEALTMRLREAGIPLDSLEGRVVRVRGVIEESGGPAIRLADPLALELVDGTD